MPFTPFHLGAGLGAKGAAAPAFSWTAFCAAQVVIDCESLYHIVRRDYPVHRFFHSFVGAGLAGTAASAGIFLLLHLVGRTGSLLEDERWRRIPAFRGEVAPLGVWSGGVLGGLSHTVLDGMMHRDVRPFMPWSDGNPFLGIVSVGTLHLLCVSAAMLGALGLTLWKRAGKVS
jgi:hypothetical protein